MAEIVSSPAHEPSSPPVSQAHDARVVVFPDGIAIQGEFASPEVLSAITRAAPRLPLIIADPPYGNVVKEAWDRTSMDDRAFAQWMTDWTSKIEIISEPGAALYVFGGIGKPREGKKPPFRPFYRYMLDVELETGFRLSSHITWKKKCSCPDSWTVA